MDITFTEKQKQILATKPKRWNLYGGAVRSGKTWLQYWQMLKATTYCVEPYLLSGKTTGALNRNVIEPMRAFFGNEIVGRINGSEQSIFIGGKKFYIICANDDRAIKKIQGGGYGLAVCDEVTTWPQNYFEMLKSRLDKLGAEAYITFNPDHPFHWFKTDFLDKRNDKTTAYWHFTLDDNDKLDPAYVEALKSEYTGVWYDRYILGLWAAAEGLIFDMFTDSHIFTSLPPNVKILREWVACDYGTQNAFVALIVAQCSDGVYRVMKEYRHDGRESKQQKTDSQYADELDHFITAYGRIPQSIIVDPSAASFITELKTPNANRRHHMPIRPALNPVLDGIRRLASLISTDRVNIHQDCVGLINEMRTYAWDNETGKRTGVDTPFKEHDHGPDALRYWAYTMTNASGIIVVS